jgi:hypothetical protein
MTRTREKQGHSPAAGDFADRYAAVWNEPDSERRRARIRDLWSEDAVHILHPPEEVRKAAGTLGMTSSFEARGRTALDLRVTRAYEEFVAPGEYVFRARGNAVRLQDVIKLGWEMVRTSDGAVVAAGTEFLVMGGDDKARLDYQFIEA